MKYIITFFLLATFYFQLQAQTVCESKYALVCDEERRLADEDKQLQLEKLRIEERQKAIKCRKAEITTEKQNLIVCITNEKNQTDLTKIRNVLLQTLDEIDKIKTKPSEVPKPCVGGNCN